MKDLYALLNLKQGATKAEIRKRWRELAHLYHPDHNPDDPDAEAHFKDIQEAYRILSDETLRLNYDLGIFKDTSFDPSANSNFQHYFYATCDVNKVKCFEELSITFTYSGSGRIFRRPSFENFHITGSPFVDSRMVFHEGRQVKETSLTYIVCPLKEGILTVDAASIRIEGKNYTTSPIEISASPNVCFFIENHSANGQPFKYAMHFEFKEGEEPLRLSELKKNHTILIPRSKGAYIFHSIGTAMKWICTLWGTIMFNYYFGWNLLAGALAGNVLAGLNVQLMYWLVNMKAKYRFAPRYPLVQEYQQFGYFPGESLGIPLLKSDLLYRVGRLLV